MKRDSAAAFVVMLMFAITTVISGLTDAPFDWTISMSILTLTAAVVHQTLIAKELE